MTSKKKYVAFVGFAASAALLAACSAEAPDAGEGNGEDNSVLRVGVTSAQTGHLAPFDVPALRAFEMHVDEINEAGGIGGEVEIELTVQDTRSEAAQTATVAQEMLQEGHHLLVTPCDAEPSIAAGQMAQEEQIPAISMCASDPSLPGAVGEYMFTNMLGNNAQGWAAAEWALGEGYENAVLVKSPDSGYTNSLPLYFGEVFEAGGGEVAATIDFSMEQQNFDAIVSRIAGLDPEPDVVHMGGYEPDFPAFVRQLRSAGLDMTVITGSASDTPTTLEMGSAADGVIITAATFQEPGNPTDEFEQAFEERYGEPSGTAYGATGYDMGTIIEAAVENADGDLSGPNLRDALDNIENVQGATGNITMKDGGRVTIRTVYILEIVDGERTLIQEMEPDASEIPEP